MTVRELLKAHGLKTQDEADELLVKLAHDREALLKACKGIWDRMDELAAVRREGITGAAYSAVLSMSGTWPSFNVDITDEFNAVERAIAQAEAK